MPTPNDYSDFRFGKDHSATRQEGNFGTGGDYGATSNAPTSNVAADTYPNAEGYGYDASNPQFSSDKEGDPIKLLESTRPGIDSHADLNYSYGLCQPVATLGNHPLLRDELSNPTEKEAGAAEPDYDIKVPKRDTGR
jgi:hypothetical protein